MGYYEKNLECIKKIRDFMYQQMMKSDISLTTNRVEYIKDLDTREQIKALAIGYKGKEYRLNSSYYPMEEARKWALQYKSRNLRSIITMYGFGNGTFARALLENAGDSYILLIYEPSADIFYHTLANYDVSDILSNGRVSLSVEGINDFEFQNSLKGLVNISNIGDLVMCMHPHYKEMFPESCITYWEKIKESYYSAKMNINTEIHFGRRYIENTLKNMQFLRDSITLDEIRDSLPKDVPAIVVAAGPSVVKNIDLLKKAKGKSVIFAVDRILDFLLDSGLEPDFVVTLDALKPVKYFSQRDNVTVPLIYFQESNYEITEKHKGKKIICNCAKFLKSIYTKLGIKPPYIGSSASVATVAFTICLELGYQDIILVGQDLAYDGDQSHAGKEEDSFVVNRDIMIEDIHGNMIRSRRDWKEFVKWYEDTLTVFPQINVIDAKEKGARIKGTTVMPLEEAICRYCTTDIDCDTLFDQSKKTFTHENLKDIKKYLEENYSYLKMIRRKSKEAVKICDGLLKNSRAGIQTEPDTQIKKLSNISSYISKKPVYFLMDRYVIAISAQSIMEMNHFTENHMENCINTYEKSKNIFEAFIEAVDYIEPKLKEAIELVMPKQEE